MSSESAGDVDDTSDEDLPIRIFMSYRRRDSPHFSGRLYDKLATSFGHANVFRDIDSIKPGSDFLKVITDTLHEVDGVIVLIGPEWAEGVNNPRDYIRLETGEALRSERPVIPVLVDDAPLPDESALPGELLPLLGLNAVAIRGDPDFHHDADRVIAGLHEAVQIARAERVEAARQAASEAERRRLAEQRADEERRHAEKAARIAVAEREAEERRLRAAERRAEERLQRVAALDAERSQRRAELEELENHRIAEQRARLDEIERERELLERNEDPAAREEQSAQPASSPSESRSGPMYDGEPDAAPMPTDNVHVIGTDPTADTSPDRPSGTTASTAERDRQRSEASEPQAVGAQSVTRRLPWSAELRSGRARALAVVALVAVAAALGIFFLREDRAPADTTTSPSGTSAGLDESEQQTTSADETETPDDPTPDSDAATSDRFEDQFDGELGDGWQWWFENPELWSLNDTPGWLTIVATDSFQNVLVREAPDEAFEVRTAVRFSPTSNFQFAGVLVGTDETSYVQLGRAYCSSADFPEFCVDDGVYMDVIDGIGTPLESSGRAIPNNPDLIHLRLVVDGDLVSGYFSDDGETWTLVGEHTLPGPSTRVGLIAGQAQLEPAVAGFDYFALWRSDPAPTTGAAD